MRELYTARLANKILLSAAAECYHLEFAFDGAAPTALESGQFLSMVAADPAGKTYTRAYSIASAPSNTGTTQSFDLCVNRVAGGFFSNLLCDLNEGEMVQCHGPHGLFTLRPAPADALLIAAGTGIAPMRSFAQSLFPSSSVDNIELRQIWLIYEASNPGELFYDSYFRELSAMHANFHYLPVQGGKDSHQPLEAEIARIVAATQYGAQAELAGPAGQIFPSYGYVCGLNEVVKPARAKLAELGWGRRQVLFERYD